MPRRVLIMGAAGRDFHNFNVVYRDDASTEVVAFTATQIPFINDRRYPAALAGDRYPDGIQIHDESELVPLIRDLDVDDVVFSYSDVPPSVRDARRVDGPGRRRELRAAGARRDDAAAHGADGRGHRGPHGRREVPDDPGDRGRAEGRREAGRGRPPSDAVRRPRRATGPALRGARRPRSLRLHDRGARGVRAAHRLRHGDLRGRGLRRDPRAGAGGVRRAAVGRREQRSAVLPPGRVDRARRPAAGRPRAGLPPGRDEPARRRRRADQQDGLRTRPTRSRSWSARSRRPTPGATVVRANSPVSAATIPTRSAASGSSWSRTAPRSRTAG